MNKIMKSSIFFICLCLVLFLSIFVRGLALANTSKIRSASSYTLNLPAQHQQVTELAADPACGTTVYCGRNAEVLSARWHYPNCTESCGTETWFLRGLSSSVGTFKIVPSVTTGSAIVTISITISTTAPAGNYPFTIGANCSGSTVCNPASLVLTVLAPSIAIVSESIQNDEITLDMKPEKVSGALKITATGDKASPIVYQKSTSGGLGKIIPYGEQTKPLPASKYTSLTAEWTVNNIKYTATTDIRFTVLGNIQHTQYNIPYESKCKAAATPVQLWAAKAKCVSHNGSYKADFASQVNLNGTGVPLAGGYTNDEAFCAKATTTNNFRDPGKLKTACGGTTLGNDNVAVNLSGGKISCGDSVLIVKYKAAGKLIGTIKSAVDNCPACKNSTPGTVGHIDNFTTDGACSGVPSLGNFQTILLGK